MKQVTFRIPKRTSCRACGSPIIDFLDFGYLPLAGSFLKPGSQTAESLYPMQVAFCPTCTLVQIPNVIPKEILFDGQYHCLSSVTSTLRSHFEEYAGFLSNLVKGHENPFIVEFGCNDGVLLSQLKRLGLPCLGIDAASNVVDVARSKGLDAICDFLSDETAKKILAKYPRPAVVTGSNVFAHNDDVDRLLRGVQTLLPDDGYFIVEVHYLLDLLRGLQFDFFYHEHCNYYSVRSLMTLLEKYQLAVVDVQRLGMHSGSIRVVSKPLSSPHPISKNVGRLLEEETRAGLDQLGTYLQFVERMGSTKRELVGLLTERKRAGKRIVGYGASGRSVTLLNHFGIDASFLDFMVDASPVRAGHLMPGIHIPIFLPERFRLEPSDVCLVTAWSYTDEILKKEAWYLDAGKEWIIPLPVTKSITSRSLS